MLLQTSDPPFRSLVCKAHEAATGMCRGAGWCILAAALPRACSRAHWPASLARPTRPRWS
eukprot:3417988-Pyramimonas_sp.AAC.1